MPVIGGVRCGRIRAICREEGRTWLTENEVKDIRDISGLKHLSAARARLQRIGLSDDQVVGEVDKIEEAAGNGSVNVLVVVPTFVIVEEVRESEKYRPELTYDQCRGRRRVLCRGNAFYPDHGSSGMGKSQLAFALGGRRPYFTGLLIFLESAPRAYNIFFRYLMRFFNGESNKEEILKYKSSVYDTGLLWTYGFIRALLEYCSSDEHQNALRMIHFDNQTVLKVERRDKKLCSRCAS
ncbi:hypothetical protein Plhal304r1_c010g0039321 [Plasmopara halstedii]